MRQNKVSSAWAISGFVLGIISLLICIMPYFGLPLSVLGLILRSKNKEHGLSTAGLVLNIIGIVVNSIVLLFVLMFVILANI